MKEPASRNTSAKCAAEPAWDEDGRLIRRVESELFHAEDREAGEDEDNEDEASEDVSERRVSAALDPDGTLTVSSFERDLRARLHGDRDEEEFHRRVVVPEHAIARLAYELVRDRFRNDWRGDEAFASFCTERDIPFDDDQS